MDIAHEQPAITAGVADAFAESSGLFTSRGFFDLLLSSIPDVFFVKDADFRIVMANPAFLALYPEDIRDNVIGFTTLEAYDEEQANAFLVNDRLAFETGESSVVETIDFPDGKRRVLFTRKIRFEDTKGACFILGISRDVTEIIEAKDKLAESLERLDEFAHIASHDLREPLRGIENLIQFVKEDHRDALPADVMLQLDRMSELRGRADSLVAELLSYSKLSHSEKRTEEVDLNILVQEAVQAIGDDSRSSIRVLQTLPALECEPVAIRQLFQNLIMNGLKYNTAPAKCVEIGLADASHTATDTGAIFFVRDNGIGIAEKHHEQVFKIFRRLHHKDDFGGGTGAGLTFVKRIVERHGGRIWVESDESCGTTFFFTLAP